MRKDLPANAGTTGHHRGKGSRYLILCHTVLYPRAIMLDCWLTLVAQWALAEDDRIRKERV
jgi:hypothetical protein